MALRDELIEQKRKEKENREKALKRSAKPQQKPAETEKQEAGAEEREAAARFDELKSDVAKGNPPEEWIKLYDKYIAKIKAELSGTSEEFSFTDEVTQEYYEQKEKIHSGRESERTLLNGYIAKRLKEEGFKNVVFELRRRTEYYSTPEDFENQRRLQEEYDESASQKYYAAVEKYNSNYLDMEAPNQADKAYRPRQAPLSKSGVKYHYEIVVSGSLYEFNESKKRRGSSMSGLVLLPILLGAIGFFGGFYFYVKGGLFGKDLGALAPFIILAMGAALGLAVVGIEKCIRVMYVCVADDRNPKGKKIKTTVIFTLLSILLLAAFVAIAGAIVYAVILTL
ncbi:MAG: hypothetical protein J1F39_01530 [Clostridiales bacterium]|nr:hypothetical protein [Clostridiales bacterium]